MEQISLFDILHEKYQVTKPIKLIELFAGYGSQNLALKYLGANYEHHRICEWATKSIQAYNDIHIQDYTDYSQCCTYEEVINYLFNKGISMNYSEPMTYEQIKRKGEQWCRTTYNNIIATRNLVNIQEAKAYDLDITDTENFTYLLTYSFPCQDLSLAGKGKGMTKGSGTRSGLLWEVERLLDECVELNKRGKGHLPNILIMENVPQVVGTNSIKDFQDWVTKLESLGYSNFVEILNAKDYGIPQNRERCFMVSILGTYTYKMPKKRPLQYRLKDLLENEVDEKYYLSQQMIEGMMNTNFESYKLENKLLDPNGAANCIIARFEGTPQCIKVGNYSPSGHNASSIVSGDGIAPTVMENHGTVTAVVEKPNLKQQMCEELIKNGQVQPYDVIRHSYTNSRMNGQMKDIQQNNLSPTLDTRCDCLGVVVKDTPQLVGGIGEKKSNGGTQYYQQDRIYDSNAIAMCHPANLPSGSYMYQINDLRIRKLTPRECWRLMGVKDEDFNNVSKNQSNSSLYHLAGDSIVTTCLMGLMGELLGIDYQTKITELVEDLKQE